MNKKPETPALNTWREFPGGLTAGAAAVREHDAVCAWYEDRIKALTTPTPPRRLRAYKGVTYRDGEWWFCGAHAKRVASLIHSAPSTFDDDDYEPLLALRDETWEPVETLEVVVTQWWDDDHQCGPDEFLADLCTRVRAWLAQQPQPVSLPYTLPITPEQAVAVLVAHGSKKARLNDAWHCSRISEREKYVIVLPTATPEGK